MGMTEKTLSNDSIGDTTDSLTAFIKFILVFLAAGVGILGAIIAEKAGNIALIIIPIVLIFITVLLYPRIGISVLIFIIYINLSPVLETYFNLSTFAGFTTAQIFVVFLTGVLVIRVLFFRDQISGLPAPIILIGLYNLVGLFTLIYARNFDLGLSTLIDDLKDAFYSILIVAFLQDRKALRLSLWALVLAGFTMASISIFQQFTGTFTNVYWGFGQTITSSTGTGYRLAGPIGDPNYYAMFLVAVIPMALDRLWNEKHLFLRVISGWTVLSCTMTVLYTYSRGGFLALILVLVLFAFRFRSRTRFVPGLLGVSIVFLTIQFLPANYTERISSLLSFFPQNGTNTQSDASILGRSSQVTVAYRIFLDHPVAGVGIANYDTYYYEYARPIGMDPSVGTRRAHDLYLQIAAERGLLGLLAFSMIIFVTIKSLINVDKRIALMKNDEYSGIASAITIGIAGYLTGSLFLHDAYIRYLWVLIGIAWSLPKLVQHTDSESYS